MTEKKLLKESRDELVWFHRLWYHEHRESKGINRIIRLIQKIEDQVGLLRSDPFEPIGLPSDPARTLQRLKDDAVEQVMTMSDEDLRKECEENGEDFDAIAYQTRATIREAVKRALTDKEKS